MHSTDIDGHILDSCRDRWQKVAMVIVKARDSAGLHDTDHSEDAIVTRIDILAHAGKLDAVGNLKDWRHSEVRLRNS
jgi:hypothetical protein